MLTLKEIIELSNTFFPNNYGVLITGSQQVNTIFKKERDIDIIIFDSLVSNQFGLIAEKNGYKIDFIVMPIFDIENVMDNSLHEPKNGLLHLMQATILSDPYNIINPILKKATILFNTVQYRTQLEYERFMIELMKLRKLFASELSEAEKAILLSDFISIASLLETIKVTNWSSKTKHKLRNLNQKSPEFLNQILYLHNQGLKHEYNKIIAFINFYEKDYLLAHLPPKDCYKTLVVEISWRPFSIVQFVKDILTQITETEVLGTNFQYFYLSPKKYKNKYKHNVCMVFKVKSQEDILALLEKIHDKKNSLNVQTIFFEHFCEGNRYGLLDDYLIEYKIELSSIIKNIIKEDNDFNTTKAFDLFFYLCFFAKDSLGINHKEFQKVNSIIAQKWLFTKAEQDKVENYPALIPLRNSNMQRANIFYTNNLPSLKLLELSEPLNHTIENSLLNKCCSTIKKIASQKHSFKFDDNDIIFKIISAFKFDTSKIVVLYRLIIEDTLLVLNLSDTDKFNALYCCSKAVDEFNVEGKAQVIKN